MKYLTYLIIILVTAACSTAPNKKTAIRGPYTVTGVGPTEEVARQDGFRKAVEISMGVAVLSERLVKSDTVAKNYVLTHSSGYVDSFTIKNTNKNRNNIELEMVVYIKPTLLDDYVLNQSDKNFTVNGEQLKESLNTFYDERTKGDDMLMAILKDYPSKAYDFKAQPVAFKVGEDRSLYAEVTYSLKFSDAYLRSLAKVLNQVKDNHCSVMCNNLPFYRVSYKKKDTDYVNTNETFYFKDVTRPKLVYTYLRGGYFAPVYSQKQDLHANVKYAIKVDFRDFNRNVLNTNCYYSPHAKKQDYWEGQQFFIDNQNKIEETFHIIIKQNNWLSDHYKNLDKFKHIDVSVVRPEECKEV